MRRKAGGRTILPAIKLRQRGDLHDYPLSGRRRRTQVLGSDLRVQLPDPHPGPGPVNFPQFLAHASLLASLEDATNKISDGGVRDAVRRGIVAAVEALEKRAGVRVSMEAAGGAAGGAR